MTPVRTLHPARGASLIALLAGIWLLFSPWIYGAVVDSNAWNMRIVGALIFFLAVIRMHEPAKTSLSWFNSALGIWIFVSPWIFGYNGNMGSLTNSLFVGIIVFCAAIAGANSEKMNHDMNSTST